MVTTFGYLSRCGFCSVLVEDPFKDEREITNFNGRKMRSASAEGSGRRRVVVERRGVRSRGERSVEMEASQTQQKVVPRDKWERANVKYGLTPRKFVFSNQSGMTVYMVVTARKVEETSAAIKKLATVIGAEASDPDVARYRSAARAQKMFVTKGTQQEVGVEESKAYISVLSRDRLNNWVEHLRNYYVDVGYTKVYQLLPADVAEGKTLDKMGEIAYGCLI